MRNRQIHRTYLAVVHGVPPEQGTVSAPIARKSGSAIEREVNFETGEAAVTHYERLAVNNGYSLLAIRLETGRTHQIRVHMKYLGYPLPGDYLYYPEYSRIRRQALHSYQLEFSHPVTGESLLFTAPVPDDLSQAFCNKESFKMKAQTNNENQIIEGVIWKQLLSFSFPFYWGPFSSNFIILLTW